MMNLIKIYCYVLLTLFTFNACTKTIDLEPLVADRILEYKVSNVPEGESLYAAIDHTSKTITLYVPFYYGLELIDPEIKLSSGAKLADEIVPIGIETKNHTYTVIASDGTRSSYTLQIEPQNTPTLEAVWGIFGYPKTQPLTYPLHILPFIHGNFYSNNPALVKATLLSRNTKKEVVLNSLHNNVRLVPITNKINLYNLTNLPIPANIDTGYHDVKLDYLGHSVTLADPINIQYRAPKINFSASQVVKQGAEINYPAIPFMLILDPVAVKVTANGQVYDFKIVKHDLESITLRVPEDFPVGQAYYDGVATYKGWPNQTGLLNLTISPK